MATKKPPVEKKKPEAGSIAQVLRKIAKEIPEGGTLGHAAAVVIACQCANTSPQNLPRTLKELGTDRESFPGCVHNGIAKAKCTFDIDDIPNSDDTRLIRVVSVIQNAPKQ